MIHKYHMGEHYLVLDTCSGAVHDGDELAYCLLDDCIPLDRVPEQCPEESVERLSGRFCREDILECFNELHALYKDGLLFAEDDYEPFASQMGPAPIKACTSLTTATFAANTVLPLRGILATDVS